MSVFLHCILRMRAQTPRLRLPAVVLSTGLLFAAGAPGAAESPGPEKKAPIEGVFAKVGDTLISTQEYDGAFSEASRQKFYHGKPPEAEVNALRREVGDRLINRVLLRAEAERRGLKPDQEKIRKTIEGYDKQYAASEQWKANREKMLPGLTTYLEAQSVLESLEAQVRSVPDGTEAETRAYYDAHPDHFTEPEQNKVSVILLKVEPSAPQPVWDKAREEAQTIMKRLRGGADFTELARIHSADASASAGGDMGYLHRGMLPEAIQKALDGLQVGDITGPLQVLEGMAIIRLDARKAAKRREFADVKERVAALWKRERSDQVWKEFLARLRADAAIVIDETRYPPAMVEGKK